MTILDEIVLFYLTRVCASRVCASRVCASRVCASRVCASLAFLSIQIMSGLSEGQTVAGFRIKSSLLEGIFQRVVAFAQVPENMDRIDTYVISPLLNHLFQKIFPYLVLTAVMFLLVFAMLASVLVLLLMNTRGSVNL